MAEQLQQAQQQLESLQDAAARRESLEAELTASRANLEAMTRDLEAAREASRKIQ
jgi:CHAD domain-containing protein